MPTMIGAVHANDDALLADILSQNSFSQKAILAALNSAALNNRPECLALLIAAMPPGNDDFWALHTCAYLNLHECLARLIPATDFDHPDAASVLATAAGAESVECLLRLLPFCDPKRDFSAALRAASAAGSLECMKILIPLSDPTGSGSLAAAAENGHAAGVELMLPHAPLCFPHALERAAASGHAAIVSRLLDAFPERGSLPAAGLALREALLARQAASAHVLSAFLLRHDLDDATALSTRFPISRRL